MTRCWSKHVEIGDLVFNVNDPTHIGRIELVHWSHTALVRWVDTGWISEEKLENLKAYVLRRRTPEEWSNEEEDSI